jgi:Tol biopolymer transport system component
LSDRSGTWDIWSLTVLKGKPDGQPKLIFSDAGEIKSVEITRNGTLYFRRFGRKFTITISPFDTSEGKIKKESGMPLLGSNYDAEWSPDGQSIAYNKEIMETVGNSTKLYVYNLNTAKESPIAENLEVPLHASWSPKENTILAIGLDNRKISDKNYFGGIYNIDIKTGKETELLSFTRDSFKDLSLAFNMAVEWSMDAKSIFYIKENHILQFNLETGLQNTFYTAQNSLKYLKRFSHGNELVFMDGKQIMKASGENGDIKKLCTLEDNQRIGSISWSPDGNYIYLYVDEWLCKLPSDGGILQKICPLAKETRFVSIHPEGKKIAITKYYQKAGFLVMENLVQELEKLEKLNK